MGFKPRNLVKVYCMPKTALACSEAALERAAGVIVITPNNLRQFYPREGCSKRSSNAGVRSTQRHQTLQRCCGAFEAAAA